MDRDIVGMSLVVYSALPVELAEEVGAVLVAAGVGHVSRGVEEPVASGVAAVEDSSAVALIGPVRSRDVAETLEATAAAGLPLIAPLATWAGVTRADEPGCEDDPADHRGTVFRLLARDTVVAARIAAEVRGSGRRAFVVAGEHEYGVQLDGQLRLARLPRASEVTAADLLVLCGLVGEPELERARLLAPLPVIAFDGVQGADLGLEREVRVALPFAPSPRWSAKELFSGVERARRAAELVAGALHSGAANRASLLARLRAGGEFDQHGDPYEPDVWLWYASNDWQLQPDRALTRSG